MATGNMDNWKPTVDVLVAFEKTETKGSCEINLTLLLDGSVYLDGADELIFPSVPRHLGPHMSAKLSFQETVTVSFKS